MVKGLTKRQEQVLHFIIDCIRENGSPPTIAEIGEEMGISSTNGVNDHLLALERKGFITRTNKARGIHVTELAAMGLYKPDVASLPLIGSIAAGAPILAQENIEDFIPVSAGLARQGNYCLTVRGDSMIEDGILDGDIIVVDRNCPIREGDIVVALIEEEEATVKFFHPRGSTIELHPANHTMEPIVVPARDVILQGKVVGLYRTF